MDIRGPFTLAMTSSSLGRVIAWHCRTRQSIFKYLILCLILCVLNERVFFPTSPFHAPGEQKRTVRTSGRTPETDPDQPPPGCQPPGKHAVRQPPHGPARSPGQPVSARKQTQVAPGIAATTTAGSVRGITVSARAYPVDSRCIIERRS